MFTDHHRRNPQFFRRSAEISGFYYADKDFNIPQLNNIPNPEVEQNEYYESISNSQFGER